VPRTLPALLRAYELGARAAAVGFDWVKSEDVLAKLDEELGELKEAVADHRERASAEEEMGDLLFTLVNLSRKMGIEPEAALRVANEKFQRRFEAMEQSAKSAARTLRAMSLDELESLWQLAKAHTKVTKDTKTINPTDPAKQRPS